MTTAHPNFGWTSQNTLWKHETFFTRHFSDFFCKNVFLLIDMLDTPDTHYHILNYIFIREVSMIGKMSTLMVVHPIWHLWKLKTAQQNFWGSLSLYWEKNTQKTPKQRNQRVVDFSTSLTYSSLMLSGIYIKKFDLCDAVTTSRYDGCWGLGARASANIPITSTSLGLNFIDCYMFQWVYCFYEYTSHLL